MIIDEIILQGYRVNELPIEILEKLDRRCNDLEKELRYSKKPSKMALSYKRLFLNGAPVYFRDPPITLYSSLYEPDGNNYQKYYNCCKN